MLRRLLVVLAPMLLAACATVPDATVHYYRAMAKTQIALTQTVMCTPDGKSLLIGYSVVNTTTNRADPATDYSVHIKDLDGNLANIALAFKFTEDGRLVGVNTTQTGQGDVLVGDITSIAAAEAKGVPPPVTVEDACKVIAGAKDKTVTLTYRVEWTYAPTDASRSIKPVSVALTPDDAAATWYKAIGNVLPGLTGTATPLAASSHRVVDQIDASNAVILKLNDVIPVHLAIMANPGPHEVWGQDIVVPFVTKADDYVVAIPKAALFGKQTFALTLLDSGAVSELDFGKDSGAGAITTSVGSVYNTVRPRTAAEKLADLKAADDLKAEQVRAAKCNADPSGC